MTRRHCQQNCSLHFELYDTRWQPIMHLVFAASALAFASHRQTGLWRIVRRINGRTTCKQDSDLSNQLHLPAGAHGRWPASSSMTA